MKSLIEILREVLEEKKKKKADRCLRIARTKYDKPSAYRSGAIVRCRAGSIWKGVKEEDIPEGDILEEDIESGDALEEESLNKWFSRKGGSGSSGGWVDCNTCRKVDGKTKCKPCGRQKGEDRAKYPSCRATPASCKRPGKGKTWGKTK